MRNAYNKQPINDLLGSAVVFANAVNDFMAVHLEEISDGEVTFAQLKLLKLLALKERLSVSAIAEFMGISPAAASKAIDRLERSGMLMREEARSDRRALRVSLTAKAIELLDRYDKASAEQLREIFGYLSRSQLDRLAKTLDELSISIVNHADGREDTCFRCGIHFRDKCLLRSALHRTCYMDLRDNGTSDLPGHRSEERTARRPPP